MILTSILYIIDLIQNNSLFKNNVIYQYELRIHILLFGMETTIVSGEKSFGNM